MGNTGIRWLRCGDRFFVEALAGPKEFEMATWKYGSFRPKYDAVISQTLGITPTDNLGDVPPQMIGAARAIDSEIMKALAMSDAEMDQQSFNAAGFVAQWGVDSVAAIGNNAVGGVVLLKRHGYDLMSAVKDAGGGTALIAPMEALQDLMATSAEYRLRLQR